jgi:hypothetical protein
MSEQHCKALALPPNSLKHWPDCPGGGQIAQVLAILLKSLPDRSSAGQKGKLLTLSLPWSARLLKESDLVIPCHDSVALVRNDQ